MKKLPMSFYRGLRSQHPAILIGAFMFFAATLCGIECLFRSSLIARLPEKYLLRHSGDLFTHIALQLHRFREGSARKDNLYFLGGSSIAYAVETENFKQLIRKKTGRDSDVFNFGVGRQSLLESLAFVDSLPDGSGTVFLGLNPRIMGRKNDARYERWRYSHLLVRSSALNDFLAENGMHEFQMNYVFPQAVWRIKHHLWIHRSKFLSGRLPQNEYLPTWYSRLPLSEKKKQWFIERFIMRSHRDLDLGMAFNARTVERIVEVARRKGLNVVLLELPMNPAIKPLFRTGFLQNYHDRMNALSRGWGVPYLQLQTREPLVDADYVDAVHVLATGRHKIHEALVEKIHVTPNFTG